MAGSGKTVGEVVRQRRLASGMTQEDLARRAGVSLATIRSIETERVKKPYRLREIYRALGVEGDRPAAELSDEDLIAEIERRWPGKIGRLVADEPEPGGPRPRRPVVTRKGDADEPASGSG